MRLLLFLLLGAAPFAQEDLKPLEGGLTRAELYTYEADGERWVVRYLDTKKRLSERAGEIQAQRVGHSLGIAPPCTYVDEESTLIVMPFVPGHPLGPDDLANPAVVEQLGKKIASLHRFCGDYPTRNRLVERIAIQYGKGIREGTAFPTGFGEEVERVTTKSPSRPLVPTHGDLNRSNILVTGEEVTFIDWTNATWDDPFSDLAYLSLISNMSEEQERGLLSAYFGRLPTTAELHELDEVKRRVCLLAATIWLRCWGGKEPPDERLSSPSLPKAEEYLRSGTVVNPYTGSKEAVLDYGLSFYRAYLERGVEQSMEEELAYLVVSEAKSAVVMNFF